MKIDLVFLVILGFMVLRTVCNNKTEVKEHMAADDMKAAINAIYDADISAIQNLSSIATKLQTGGYTCPGDYTVTGKMTVNGKLFLGADAATSADGKDILSRLVAAEAKIAAAEATIAALKLKCDNITADANGITKLQFGDGYTITEEFETKNNPIEGGGGLYIRRNNDESQTLYRFLIGAKSLWSNRSCFEGMRNNTRGFIIETFGNGEHGNGHTNIELTLGGIRAPSGFY